MSFNLKKSNFNLSLITKDHAIKGTWTVETPFKKKPAFKSKRRKKQVEKGNKKDSLKSRWNKKSQECFSIE